MADPPQPQPQNLYGVGSDRPGQSSAEILQALSVIQQQQVHQVQPGMGSPGTGAIPTMTELQDPRYTGVPGQGASADANTIGMNGSSMTGIGGGGSSSSNPLTSGNPSVNVADYAAGPSASYSPVSSTSSNATVTARSMGTAMTSTAMGATTSTAGATMPQMPVQNMSEFDALFAKLKEKPHDPEGWRRLVDHAEQSGDIEKIRAAFDGLLKQYPNTSSAQIRYINQFLADQSTFSEAEELFKKFLRTSPCVDLWKFYLNYVRRLNTSPATRDIVRKSYEFALQHVGQDKDSGQIWSDYIQFIRSGEATTTWEEQQQMDALRKIYHRAVQIPLDNVEQLWRDLEAFETNLNRITAKKFMADLSPAHMQARTTLRQLINHVASLYPPSFNNAYPPLPDGSNTEIFMPLCPTFDLSERALVGKWKAYLKWEESNPLEIEDRDRSVFISRVQAVYRKAVIRMRYYSEIWFMAYNWMMSVGRQEEALSMLKAGMEAIPTSFLLTFAHAETQETRKDYAEVHATYERFLEVLRAELERLEQESGEGKGKSPESRGINGTGNGYGTGNGAASGATPTGTPFDNHVPGMSGLGGGTSSTGSSFNTQSSKPSMSAQSELADRRSEYGLAYIVYMRFGRRAEGIKASRAAFGKARRDRWTPWQVYEAAALMEYHCSDDKTVASRIFEKGLDLFGDEIEFVLRYLGFLISINDANNARALFERVIGTFSPDTARSLWERWARYEYQYGDLEAAQKLEKRMTEAYPQDPPMKRFAQRHMYLGVDAIASRDLGFAMAKKAGASGASSTSGASAAGSGIGGGGAPLGRTETQQLLMPSTPVSAGTGHKRPSSPDGGGGGGGGGGGYGRKRDESRGRGGGPGSDYGAGHKRMREMSPMRPERGRGGGDRDRERERDRERDRDRERERDGRWGGEAGLPPPPIPPPRRRYSPTPTSWEREKGRDKDRDEDKGRGPPLPNIISWFIGELPAPSCFDGPVFRTDDLMNLFRNAIIPSSSGIGAGAVASAAVAGGGRAIKSPPPVPAPRGGGGGGGRPPPDYSPYQGPGGGRSGRRY
ncbi:hypothetical protein AX17_004835 [Amanita inopinata Kibby_2008]|nr:hypothetical protein AX17_004835 [Amanita inopinata Kibby_2008]